MFKNHIGLLFVVFKLQYMKRLLIYKTQSGKEPLISWIEGLKDRKAVSRIRNRIQRLELGIFGDYKPVGDGIYELRFHFGPGYRLYFAIEENSLLLLLCAGDKDSQKHDIDCAKKYYTDYIETKKCVNLTTI